MSEANKKAIEALGKSLTDFKNNPAKFPSIDIPILTLPERDEPEINYKALDEMVKQKRKQDNIRFWIPVILSIIAIAISIFK